MAGAPVAGGSVVGATVLLVAEVVGAATTVIVATAVSHTDSAGPQSWYVKRSVPDHPGGGV